MHVKGLIVQAEPHMCLSSPLISYVVLLNLDKSCAARRGPERGLLQQLIISTMGTMKHNGHLDV